MDAEKTTRLADIKARADAATRRVGPPDFGVTRVEILDTDLAWLLAEVQRLQRSERDAMIMVGCLVHVATPEQQVAAKADYLADPKGPEIRIATVVELAAEVERLARIEAGAKALLEAFDARDPVGQEWRDLRAALEAPCSKP